ncbi:MAG: CRTAC1 family protein [Planctomycetes bacterium]|nr:CRTAC1 family protein [Planctomycetota bacterium]
MRRARLLIASALLAACGREPDTATQPSVATSSAAAPTSQGSAQRTVSVAKPAPPLVAEPALLFPEPEVPKDAWNAENHARMDPRIDGWPLEAVHDLVRPRLIALAERVWGATEGDVGELLAAEFAGATALRGDLAVLHDDGQLVVSVLAPAERTLSAVSDWAAACAALRAPFCGAKPTLHAWIEELRAEGASVVVDARVCASAGVGAGVAQHNVLWRTRWSPDVDTGAPRLVSLQVLELEELKAKRRSFGDHTARWIGSPPWLEREFLRGLGESYFKQDKLTGNHLLGGHGLAVGDANGDGLEDVFLCTAGGTPNRLLLAQPDGTLRDGTAEAKVALLDNTRSALIVDLDGDRHRDIVAGVGPYVWVAYNDGSGVFGEQQLLGSSELGEEDIFSLVAGDPDRDGDLDLYCCRYVKGGMISGVPRPYHDAQGGATNLYWRNEGARRFRNATDEVGFGAANDRYSLAALWQDLDLDGDLDLYVVNDFGRNNLFVNEGGTFRDEALARGADDMAAGMGITSADFDLDGEPDLYTSNMYSAAGLRMTAQPERFLDGQYRELHQHFRRHARGNTLLRGLGGGRFEDVTESIGGARAGWSWGGMFLDIDNDRYADLLVPNGFISGSRTKDVESFFWRRVISQSPPDASVDEDYRRAWASMQQIVMDEGASYDGWERNTAFRNLGGRRLVDASALVGFETLDDFRAVARVDWDDDGREDAIVRSRTAPRLRFLRNQDESAHHFVSLGLTAAGPNMDAIGARVDLEAGGRLVRRTVHAGEGYLAQSSRRVHFGLGAQTLVDSLVVHWPDGSEQRFGPLAADARYELVQGEPAPRVRAPRELTTFATLDPSPLAASTARVERFVLVEKIPLREFALPRFDGTAPRVAALAGSLPVIVMWSVDDANSRAQLEALALRLPELDVAGVRLSLLCVDDGLKLAAARRWLQERGLLHLGGPADGTWRQRAQVLYLEVLGSSSRALMPQSLLLDSAGQWVIGYDGTFAVDTLLADAAAVAALDARAPGTGKLMGGRWALKASRDWQLLIDIYKEIGAGELAAMYESHRASLSQGR